MKLVEQYGTPLKFTYLTSNFQQHQQSQKWFRKSMEKNGYEAKYYYCYCTKSSHFEVHVMNEAFKNNIHIETSSAFDINIVEKLNGRMEKSIKILMWFVMVLNATNTLTNIARLINNGHKNTIPVIDNLKNWICYKSKSTASSK